MWQGDQRRREAVVLAGGAGVTRRLSHPPATRTAFEVALSSSTATPASPRRCRRPRDGGPRRGPGDLALACPAGEVAGPVVHQPSAALEQVGPRVGRSTGFRTTVGELTPPSLRHLQQLERPQQPLRAGARPPWSHAVATGPSRTAIRSSSMSAGAASAPPERHRRPAAPLVLHQAGGSDTSPRTPPRRRRAPSPRQHWSAHT